VSPDAPDTTTIVANVIPFEEPAGGPNFYTFAEDAQYDIHIDKDGDALRNRGLARRAGWGLGDQAFSIRMRSSRMCHSCRNATMGSILIARRAGKQQAAAVTAISNNATTIKVNGSVGETPNSRLEPA
jgi:hypothetical protein